MITFTLEFAWKLSCRGPLARDPWALDLWLGIFGLGSLAGDLQLGIFGFGSLALDLWPGIFGLGSVAWDLGLGQLGS